MNQEIMLHLVRCNNQGVHLEQNQFIKRHNLLLSIINLSINFKLNTSITNILTTSKMLLLLTVFIFKIKKKNSSLNVFYYNIYVYIIYLEVILVRYAYFKLGYILLLNFVN